jgi:hypothetical protein
VLELAAIQPPELAGALRADRRGSGAVGQQRELTDHRPTTHRADDLAVGDDLHPARSHDVGGPGRFALVK